MSAAILPLFQGVVKVFHGQPFPANAAAAVSLFPIGLQTFRMHFKHIGGAADPSASSIEDMGINHRGAHVRVPQQLLDCPDVVAGTR